MKLSAISSRKLAEEGRWFTPINMSTGEPYKTDDGREFRLLLAGSNSNAYEQAVREARSAWFNEKRLGGHATAKFMDIEVPTLARATLDWENSFEGDDGLPLDLTYENVAAVYTQVRSIRKQAQAFVEDEESFFEKASHA